MQNFSDMHDTDYRAKLTYALASAYTNADKCVSRKPHSFTTSMQERYAEAHAQGAKFFGPIAVIPVTGSEDRYMLRDMRHGWGHHPINREFCVKEGAKPTVQDVILELKHYAHWLRDHAEEIDAVVDLVSQNAHPTEQGLWVWQLSLTTAEIFSNSLLKIINYEKFSSELPRLSWPRCLWHTFSNHPHSCRSIPGSLHHPCPHNLGSNYWQGLLSRLGKQSLRLVLWQVSHRPFVDFVQTIKI